MTDDEYHSLLYAFLVDAQIVPGSRTFWPFVMLGTFGSVSWCGVLATCDQTGISMTRSVKHILCGFLALPGFLKSSFALTPPRFYPGAGPDTAVFASKSSRAVDPRTAGFRRSLY